MVVGEHQLFDHLNHVVLLHRKRRSRKVAQNTIPYFISLGISVGSLPPVDAERAFNAVALHKRLAQIVECAHAQTLLRR